MNWNIHPGEILLEEFMKPNKYSSRKMAELLNLPATRINDIVLGRRGITADTAIKLANFFSTTPRFWMNLQVSYELRVAQFNSIKNLG